MSRTQGRIDSDTAYVDGQIFVPAMSGMLVGSTGNTLTRTALGNYGVTIGATTTGVFVMPFAHLLRYGVQDWLQEQFGSASALGAQGKAVGGYTTASTASFAAGTSVNVPVLSSVGFTVGDGVLVDTVASGVQEKCIISAIPDATHITFQTILNSHSSGCWVTNNLFTTPAGVTGPPPFKGISQLTPVTSPRPKGIAIKQIYPIYTISGAALSLNTIGVLKKVNNPPANTAPTITSLLTSAANGLATATNAQPYITPIQLPTANATFQVNQFTELYIEWAVTTAAGTAILDGVFVNVSFNYN